MNNYTYIRIQQNSYYLIIIFLIYYNFIYYNFVYILKDFIG